MQRTVSLEVTRFPVKDTKEPAHDMAHSHLRVWCTFPAKARWVNL